jgi:hypothetical protein
MLDLPAPERGYQEMLPPVLVNRAALIGTGQLPKFEEDFSHRAGIFSDSDREVRSPTCIAKRCSNGGSAD